MAKKKEDVIEAAEKAVADIAPKLKPPPKPSKNEPSKTDRANSFIMQFGNDNKKVHIGPSNQFDLSGAIVRRYPTGWLSLDIALKGGFPAGSINQVKGPKNAGKSLSYWEVVHQQQLIRGDKLQVLFAMNEMKLDKTQGRKIGVKIALSDNDIYYLNQARVEQGGPPFTEVEIASFREQVGNFTEFYAESAEQLLDGVLEAIRSNAFHLIIIDSWGGMATSQQLKNESLGDKTYGGAASVISTFCKMATPLLAMNDEYGRARDVCVLGVNQVRDNMDDPYQLYRTTGGRTLEHTNFVDLFLSRGAMVGKEEDILTGAGRKRIKVETGHEINWKIEKGKYGMMSGAVGKLIFDNDLATVNRYMDTLYMGIKYGIIQQSGSWLSVVDPIDSTKVLLKTQGAESAAEFLQKDEEDKRVTGEVPVMAFIRDEIFKKEGIIVKYDWE